MSLLSPEEIQALTNTSSPLPKPPPPIESPSQDALLQTIEETLTKYSKSITVRSPNTPPKHHPPSISYSTNFSKETIQIDLPPNLLSYILTSTFTPKYNKTHLSWNPNALFTQTITNNILSQISKTIHNTTTIPTDKKQYIFSVFTPPHQNFIYITRTPSTPPPSKINNLKEQIIKSTFASLEIHFYSEIQYTHDFTSTPLLPLHIPNNTKAYLFIDNNLFGHSNISILQKLISLKSFSISPLPPQDTAKKCFFSKTTNTLSSLHLTKIFYPNISIQNLLNLTATPNSLQLPPPKKIQISLPSEIKTPHSISNIDKNTISISI